MVRFLTIIIVCWLSATLQAQGQELTFISPLVEEGIREHLNFSEEEQIGFAQLDTITTLDLSRRGITDIRDLVLMPKLRMVDLSDNKVDGLRPLTLLDSLEWVDLSYNSLKGINELAFSKAKDLTVNVAFNHIRDFSFFNSISFCNFTLEGVGLQLGENSPFFDVSQLICDATTSPVTVRGLVRTNMEETVRLVCEGEEIVVPTEDEYFKQALQYNGNTSVRVELTNGERSDATWLVPSRTFKTVAGEMLSIETGLPDDYEISSAFAEMGTAVIDGTKVKYTATADNAADVLYISYSDGIRLRGFTKYYLGNANGDVSGDGRKNIVDVARLVSIILGNPNHYPLENADMDGDGDQDYDDVIKLVNTILMKKQ